MECGKGHVGCVQRRDPYGLASRVTFEGIQEKTLGNFPRGGHVTSGNSNNDKDACAGASAEEVEWI